MIAPGEYSGLVIDASMNEGENGKAYALIKAKPDGMQETVTWFGSFSETVISSGFNKGKSVGEMTASTLGAIGWNADFTSLNNIIGKKITFGVKHEPDQKKEGELRAKVSYIKGVGSAKPLSKSTASDLASKFKGAALEALKSAPKEDPKPIIRGDAYEGPDYSDSAQDDGF